MSRSPDSPATPLPSGPEGVPVDGATRSTPHFRRGATRILIHGVGGATPEALLQDARPQQVSGDRVAGFYRRSGSGATRPGPLMEAYAWGGLTSRSRTRVLWVLLLPFMLANLAGWMAAPRTADGATSAPGAAAAKAPTSAWFRWVTRLAGLAMTIAAVLMFSLLGMDVVGYQCGAIPSCVGTAWWSAPLRWSSVAGHPARRLLMGALVPLLLLALLGYLSYASRNRYEQVEPPSEASGSGDSVDEPTAAARVGGLADPSFWSGRSSHARLSRLHLAAGVAMVSLLLHWCVVHAAAASDVAVVGRPLGLGASIVQLVVLVGVLALLADGNRHQATSGVLLCVAIAGLVATGVLAVLQPAFGAENPGTTPGVRSGVNIGWGFIAGCLLLLLVTVVAQRRRRGTATRDRPAALTRFDGWSGSPFRWGAPFVLPVVGLLLFHGIFLAVLVWVVDVLLGPPDGLAEAAIELPPVIRVVMSYMIFGGLGVLAGYVLYVIGAWLLSGTTARAEKFVTEATHSPDDPDDRTDRGDYVPVGGAETPTRRELWLVPAATRELPPKGSWWRSGGGRSVEPDTRGPTPWSRRRVRWNFLSGAARSICYLLTGLVAGAVVIALVVWVQFLSAGTVPGGWWVDLAFTIGIAIPPAVIGFMAVTWRQPERRRVLGTVWDVGTFWPRSFHPFAPPCYSERAVPELLRRIWWLHDNGERIVLAAHSQGSVIAFAAALRRSPRSDEPVVGLVTFGSPLYTLYSWAFPAYLPPAIFDGPAGGTAGLGELLWRNVFYPTDYIGGPVVGKVGRATDDGGGPAAATIDVRLADPASDVYVYGQPTPPVLTHTGYWRDDRLWRVVDGVAGDLVRRPAAADGSTPSAGRVSSTCARIRPGAGPLP